MRNEIKVRCKNNTKIWIKIKCKEAKISTYQILRKKIAKIFFVAINGNFYNKKQEQGSVFD